MNINEEAIERYRSCQTSPEKLLLTCVHKYNVNPSSAVEAINRSIDPEWGVPGTREFNKRVIHEARMIDAGVLQRESWDYKSIGNKLDKILSIVKAAYDKPPERDWQIIREDISKLKDFVHRGVTDSHVDVTAGQAMILSEVKHRLQSMEVLLSTKPRDPWYRRVIKCLGSTWRRVKRKLSFKREQGQFTSNESS